MNSRNKTKPMSKPKQAKTADQVKKSVPKIKTESLKKAAQAKSVPKTTTKSLKKPIQVKSGSKTTSESVKKPAPVKSLPKTKAEPLKKSAPIKKPVVNRSQPEESLNSELAFDAVEACALISKKDKIMGKVISSVGPYRPKIHHMKSCYESLMESIVYQQLTGRAAATIMGRVKDIYQGRFPDPIEVLETEDELLRAAGLSRAKVAAIKDLSLKRKQGLVPDVEELESLSDEEIVDLLTQVKGIGEWTVQMLLMFKLGRPDVFPINDYGVRKGFARVFKLEDLPAPRAMLANAEKWRPYRSVAAWYLWRVLELK